MDSVRKAFSITAGAVLATGLGVGTLALLHTGPSSENPTTSSHQLLASPATAKKLGWIADALPGWAKMDVIAVSDADVSSDGNDLTLAATQDLNSILRKMFAGLAREQFAGTYAFSTNGGDTNNLCVMAIPATDRPAAYYASLVSSIPETDLLNVPGTAQEWASLMLAHEGSHCSRFSSTRIFGPADESLAEETHADQDSLLSYYVSKKFGAVKTSELPEVLRDMRALGTFLVFANPRYRSPSILMTEDATAASLDIEDPYALINRLRTMNGSGPKELPAISVQRDLLPVFKAVALAMGLPETDIAKSMRRAALDPQRLYKTVKTLDQNGAFRNNPLQEKYANQFLAAAEKWAPGYFGINMTKVAPTFRPGS